MTPKQAAYLIDLVDRHNWSISAAKAECKKVTGVDIKARSKDGLVTELGRFL